MKRSPIFVVFLISFLITSTITILSSAQPPDWSGDNNLVFLMEINNISIADSNLEKPIRIELAEPSKHIL